MNRLLFAVPLALFAVVGCGPNQEQRRQEGEEQVRRNAEANEKRLKGIADDMSLSDADAVRKYLDADPDVFTNLPAAIAPGWAANSTNGVWHVTLHAVLQSQSADKTPDAMTESERSFVRSRLLECRRTLEHLKGRKVGGVTLKIFTKPTGDEKYTELFRAVMTPTDLPKFEKWPELNDPVALAYNPVEANTVYDPRGPKIGDCWTVELNRYPDLEYKKR